VEKVRRAVCDLIFGLERVVRARIYEDNKFVQIASELDMLPATVIIRMRRALEKLRQ